MESTEPANGRTRLTLWLFGLFRRRSLDPPSGWPTGGDWTPLRVIGGKKGGAGQAAVHRMRTQAMAPEPPEPGEWNPRVMQLHTSQDDDKARGGRVDVPPAPLPAELRMEYNPRWQEQQDERVVGRLALGLVDHYPVGDTWVCRCGTPCHTAMDWALHAARAQYAKAAQR